MCVMFYVLFCYLLPNEFFNGDYEAVLYCTVSCCTAIVRSGVKQVTITNYFINPNGKLKLSFDRTTKNISQ